MHSRHRTAILGNSTNFDASCKYKKNIKFNESSQFKCYSIDWTFFNNLKSNLIGFSIVIHYSGADIIIYNLLYPIKYIDGNNT